ncbi:hypothetical protein D3C59_37240, partial [Streptomyces sp. SHP22-7]
MFADDARVVLDRESVLSSQGELAVGEEVTDGKLEAGPDGLGVRRDVVEQQLHQFGGVLTAADGEEDRLQLAHEVLLTERRELALGLDPLDLAGRDGGLRVVGTVL